jgi:hypothetical protein
MKKLIIAASAVLVITLGGASVFALANNGTKESPKTQEAPVVQAAETPKTETVETPAAQPEVAPVVAKPVEKKPIVQPVLSQDIREVARAQYINADSRARLSSREQWPQEEAVFWGCFESAVARLETIDPAFGGWNNPDHIMKLVTISSSFVLPCGGSISTSLISSQAINIYCDKEDGQTKSPLNCHW